MKALAELAGARLQRIDAPHSDLLALSFFGVEKGVLALWLPRGGQAEWSWLRERPRGKPANAWVQLLRKHLGNRRVSAVEANESQTTLVFPGAALRITARPANAQLLVDGAVRGGRHAPDEVAAGELVHVSEERIASHLNSAEVERRRALVKLARRRKKALRRRLAAIDADLAAADEAPELRHLGSLLLSHLHAIPDGATEAMVTDWSQEPPAPRAVPIRAGRTAKDEAEALFQRARKRERGGEIALERHELTLESLGRLDALLTSLESADVDLDQVSRRLEKEGARPQRAAAHRAGAGSLTRPPFHRFEGTGGREIRVGRSAAENDLLTLHHAKPWDHWLHARGVPGSHVVIPLGRNEQVPDALLLDAAHLAAHFSRLRGEAIVEVQHGARRHVVKPRGAPAGAVRVRKEAVLVLRLEPARLDRLLRG